MTKEFTYQRGFGGHWQSEALKGALPEGQNSPQKPPFGLYAEQLNGSAFTRARHLNFRSWLYRILPAAVHSPFQEVLHSGLTQDTSTSPEPTQMRWHPLEDPKQKTDFIDGTKTLLINGSPTQHQGGAIHLYAANANMENRYFYSADGEWLIVPYEGECELFTEFGKIQLAVGEIAVIPRGVRFQVNLLSSLIKGYICENYGSPFTLPDLGPIGSNGLANAKDFLIPHAAFEEKQGDFELLAKFDRKLWQAHINHSPLNVVAWHGNYAPYKYSLHNFNTINTVSYDHCDPSIFTVLTSQSAMPGIANMDFVIFPERWMVAEHTFRPPYYHRNVMSEYMGLIYGVYDAKGDGFVSGGGSLHNMMSGHGPDKDSLEQGINAKLEPIKQKNTLAFMFESCLPWSATAFAKSEALLQPNYQKSWQHLDVLFKQEER